MNLEYICEPVNYALGTDELIKTWNKNFGRLMALDNMAKSTGKILWRVISEPMCGGKAFYQVVKENKKTVKIRVCVGIDDDWVIPYWGEETVIDKNYVIKILKMEEKLNELFNKNKIKQEKIK